MKGYALLLAATLTAIYGYAAQAALAADRARVWATAAATPPAAEADRVWYGGALAPVTVVGWGIEAPAISRRPVCESGSRKG
ncbi:MAG: hypothetical protein ACREMJ_01645 [Gemmatimonadales bacterium]